MLNKHCLHGPLPTGFLCCPVGSKPGKVARPLHSYCTLVHKILFICLYITCLRKKYDLPSDAWSNRKCALLIAYTYDTQNSK